MEKYSNQSNSLAAYSTARRVRASGWGISTGGKPSASASSNWHNIVVKSERAGKRVMASVTRFIEDSLRLTVKARKSAVDRPWNRQFLGFTVSRKGTKLKVAGKAIDKL